MHLKLTGISIHRADLNCSNALACDPMFSLLDLDATSAHVRASRLQQLSSSDSYLQEGGLGSISELKLLDKDLIGKFMVLRLLADISSSFNRRRTTERDEQIMWSDEVYDIERSLLMLSNLHGPRNFVASCCIAAIIFIDNQLRSIAFIARLMGRHVARLKLSMEIFLGQVSDLALHSTTPRTIFWTLYVGGVTAGNRPEREWFVARLLEFCDVLVLTSWEDVEDILKTFLWSSAWDAQGILLWQCLEDAGMKSG